VRSLIVLYVAGAGGVTVATATVVKDQTGPSDVPEALCAVTCQKYVVPFIIADGVYAALVSPVGQLE